MTKRIGIIGAPSTGKTSLARGIVAELSRNGHIAEYVSEYASRYIKKYGQPTTMWEQIRIFQKQKEWEDIVPEEVEFMVTDSPLLLGLVYTRNLFDPTDIKSKLLYSDLFKMIVKEVDRYDHIIYLHPVLAPVKDGTRIQLSKQVQCDIDRIIRELFDLLKVPNIHHISVLSWDTRLSSSMDLLAGQ